MEFLIRKRPRPDLDQRIRRLNSSHFRPQFLPFLLLTSAIIHFTSVHINASEISFEPTETTGHCFEIIAGTKNLGSVLELKRFSNKAHTNILFTQLTSEQVTPKIKDLKKIKSNHKTMQIIVSESDENFTPLKSIYEIYTNQKLTESKTSVFEHQKDSLKISIKDLHSKKVTILNEPLGLVLSQQMSDLLFTRRSITDLSPKEKLVFQTFSEAEAQAQQVTTELEGQSDHLILLHMVEGQKFKTRHTASGQMISSHDLTKNIKLKPCTSSSVLTHLNSALSHKPFQNLFSKQDREKIRSCCQLF
jgi:hypothetical protein